MVKTLTSSTGGEGSTPGQGGKTAHASQPKHQNIKKKKKKQKQYFNKFNKDFLNGPYKKCFKKKKPLELSHGGDCRET